MPEKGTTESVTGQLGQTPYRVLSDSFPPQRWMPDERTSEYVSERPSNRALSNVSPTQRQMSEERTPPAIMEREPVPTVYHTARMQRENACCLEDPLPYPKPRPKERKTLQFANGNSEDDDDVSDTPPRPAPKAKSNGNVERSPHSTRHHHGTSKRAADPVDARNGQSQHSPAKKSYRSPSTRCTTSPYTPRRKKKRTRASRSTSRSASTDSEREGRKGPRRRKNPDPPSSSDCSTSEDDDDVHDRPKHTLKPPKFDGHGSFETFMAQFMNCAKHNKWTRADKLAYLRNSLEKEATNTLWDYGMEVTESLSGLTRILESRFGGQAMSDKHHIELRNRRRRKNETLQSLHSDVRRLAALAYPDAQPKMREVISCDHFLDAIADPDLELKIRERQPSDLDSALNVALQLEVWSADSERHREVQKWEKGEGKKIREISNKMEPGATGNNGRQSNFRQSHSFRHTAPNAYGGAQSGQYPPSSRGQHPTNNGAKLGTYHPGTFARPAVNPGAHGNPPRTPSQFAGCFNCGDLTHFIRDCPVPLPKGKGHYHHKIQVSIVRLHNRTNLHLSLTHRRHSLSNHSHNSHHSQTCDL